MPRRTQPIELRDELNHARWSMYEHCPTVTCFNWEQDEGESPTTAIMYYTLTDAMTLRDWLTAAITELENSNGHL